jgi:hypothetical protein
VALHPRHIAAGVHHHRLGHSRHAPAGGGHRIIDAQRRALLLVLSFWFVSQEKLSWPTNQLQIEFV